MATDTAQTLRRASNRDTGTTVSCAVFILAPRVEADIPKMDFVTTVFDDESASVVAIPSRVTQMTITGPE